MRGRDVLAVLPTGFGKSAVYQVPTVLLDGPTLIVSPLLALQRDQVEGITESAAPSAVVVNSQQKRARASSRLGSPAPQGRLAICSSPPSSSPTTRSSKG